MGAMTESAGPEGPLSWPELPLLFPDLEEPGRWLPLLERHAAILAEAAPRVRVTSVAAAASVRRHYAESLELLRIIRAQSGGETLADIGSGGGFPGLVIAAVEPDLSVHLVEPLQKRARLLEEAAAALGLRNVTIHAQRAEDAGRGPLRGTMAVVAARAVAPLAELLEYTAPFAAPGGLIALPKGSGLAAELAAATNAMASLAAGEPLIVPMRGEVSPMLSVLLLRKLGPTPAAFPRRAGLPAKRPL